MPPGAAPGGAGPLVDGMAPLIVILIASMVLTPLFVALVAPAVPGDWAVRIRPYAGIIGQELVLLGLTLRRLRRIGEDWLSLRLFAENASQALQGIGWGVILLFVNAFGSLMVSSFVRAAAGPEALERLLEREQAAVMRLLDPASGAWGLGLIVFVAVGLAPLVEEVFFRGYAFRVLKYHTGRHAAWLSALLFAAVHLYVVNFIPIFLLGLILARLYERSGNLATPIIAHATVNGLVAIATVAMHRMVG